MISQNPTAIVWTQLGGLSQSSVCDGLHQDIAVISSWIRCDTDLAKIRNFEDDWDGFGAEAPRHAALKLAQSFLSILRDRDFENPPMRIALSPSGAIAFEWLEGDSFLRAEIEDSEDIEWMLATPDRPTEFRVERIGRVLNRTSGPYFLPAIAPTLQLAEEQRWKPPVATVGGHD